MDCCGADAATLRLTTRSKMVDYLPVPLASIEEAVDEIRRGGMVILMDDKDRENEGDLCMAAQKVTPEAINFMATHGRGLICLPLTEERVRHLGIAMMVSDNTSPFGTAFTVSIDAATGITTFGEKPGGAALETVCAARAIESAAFFIDGVTFAAETI